MTDFYLDPEGGNDANAGTSFALRWRTIGSGATAARIAAGDTVRVIASPDPFTPDSATWTTGSGTVTWGSQKNLTIDACDTNWTAATNITCALSTARKQGSNAQSVTPASAFTTGKMCHRQLPAPLDLSAYQQVSFWFRHGAVVTAGAFELRLCSDTGGDTPVHTISIPAGVAASTWRVVVWDNTAALSASIQSVTLWANSDPSTTAMRIDNIVACKAPGASDCVTHQHVIGKNTVGEPEWYSILAIEDSAVTLGGGWQTEVATSGMIARPYRGTTESVATYLLLGLLPAWTQAETQLNDVGTEALPITFSGGWDRTAMSSQSGVTYINGSHAQLSAVRFSSSNWFVITNIGALNMVTAAITDSGLSENGTLDLLQIVGCTAAIQLSSSILGHWKISALDIHGCNGIQNLGVNTAPINVTFDIRVRRIHGTTVTSAVASVQLIPGNRYFITKIGNCLGYGVTNLSISQARAWAEVIGCTFSNNDASDIVLIGSSGDIRLRDCVWTVNATTTSGGQRRERILSTNDQGVPDTHKTINRYWTLESQTAVRQAGVGIAWLIKPLNTTSVFSAQPAWFVLGEIACAANALVTIKVFTRRSNTGLSIGMRIKADDMPGVGLADIQTLMTAAADTWEEITLTFTPTAAGVVQVLGIAYGGTTYLGYFDQMTVTQA